MHFLFAILGFLGFIAVWYWRLKALQEVAKDGRKVAETVANLPRKMRFKNKSGKGGLAVVDHLGLETGGKGVEEQGDERGEGGRSLSVGFW